MPWRNFWRKSKPLEIEIVPAHAKIFHNVSHDSARNIARMIRKRDQALRMEWVRKMTITAGRRAQKLATDFPESALQLPTIVSGILAHCQDARTNLSLNARGIGRPVSSKASKWALAAFWNRDLASLCSVPCAWQPGSSLDLAIQTPSSSCRNWIWLAGTNTAEIYELEGEWSTPDARQCQLRTNGCVFYDR